MKILKIQLRCFEQRISIMNTFNDKKSPPRSKVKVPYKGIQVKFSRLIAKLLPKVPEWKKVLEQQLFWDYSNKLFHWAGHPSTICHTNQQH